jgi:ABC-type multidrug transport system fused ATPase/permease subunit
MITPEFYHNRAARFAREIAQVESLIQRYAWSRMVLMIVTGILFYAGLTTSLYFYFIPLALVPFIVLIRLQVAKKDELQRLQFLHQLNQEEEKGLRNESTAFADGSKFIDPHHPYSHDLDLFGKGSVFQYINRCATQLGEEHLAQALTQVFTNFESATELILKQEAARELAQHIDFRQQVWAVGRQINDASFNRSVLYRWLEEKSFLYKKTLPTVLRWVLPAITLTVIVLVISGIVPFSVVMTMMILQIALAGMYGKRITAFQQLLGQVNKPLSNYARILELLSKQTFSSTLLKKHHSLATEAFENVQQLAKLVNALEARMNPIAMLFGNGLFLYDLHAVSNLERWREQHAAALPGWLNSLAEWDALLSPATLHFNHPTYAFAEYAEPHTIVAKQAGHLLIPNNIRVSNDVALGNPQCVWLITGANMAGKSTFLRALGVNFVLGAMGSPVCATYWSMPLITLRTGMRTTDSLQDHQSYFFAELNRLQSIMEELRSGKPMFILLDEILKGTNSTDKQLGSRELLKQLKDLNALVVLATHDIALGDLEQQHPQHIANACFEGKIENDQLTFDYTLHAGVAQKANATFLMRKMGIIP